SQHPLASAIVKIAEERKLNITHQQVEEFQSLTGKGVKAKINDQLYYVGSPLLFENKISIEMNEQMASLQIQGKTVMLLGTDEKILLLLAVADKVRESAKEVIHQLQQIGIEKTIMLTGDNERTASNISNMIGVNEKK